MTTRFTPAGNDTVVVSGGKTFISNGDVADLMLVFGKWSEIDHARKSISAIIIEKGTPGLTVLRKEDKMGHRAASTAALAFEECRVSRDNLLGGPGDGLKLLLAALNKSLHDQHRENPYPFKFHLLNDPKTVNAFALPGGRVYLFNGLLAKAESADEIAGVLAHALGHVRHRDGTRSLIYNGGTSFLIGLLFGDVTGSGAVVFASRSLVTASYSREAEQSADDFSIDVMHKLGRPTKPMGELLFRITGRQGDGGLTILAGHPLTEDRLRRLSEADRPASGPPLLTAEEWTALKAICVHGSKV